MRPLAPGRGACIASNQVMVDGRRVGWMVRKEPFNPDDSGWWFSSGFESQEYLDSPENHQLYDVNTVANHDPDIVPFLDAPVGSAFYREEGTGRFVADVPPEENELYPPAAAADGLNPAFPAVRGSQPLPEGWSVHLPLWFSRREEDERLVFWRPGLTVWTGVLSTDHLPDPDDKLDHVKKIVPAEAFALEELRGGRLARLSYRSREVATVDGERRLVQVFHGTVCRAGGYANLDVYADDEADIPTARAIWLSVDHADPV
ncbi:MAG TPA: DUF2185 domain-containing protein [Longimicrobium sp.]|nr:DUF2185 domain-containing protein [Longimicrobium sp.]